MIEAAAFGRGFGIGFSLIAAIGAQNAYVLTRGILHNHHFVVGLVCSVIDVGLITAGIIGMGRLVQAWPELFTGLTVFGALFLFVYGCLSFRRMLGSATLNTDRKKVSLKVAVLTVVALSLLNPHVYLDTVVLLGSISLQEQADNRLSFGIGACVASFVWFFCLALGGQWMQRWFQTPAAWQILDGLVGVIMWSLAWMLIRGLN